MVIEPESTVREKCSQIRSKTQQKQETFQPLLSPRIFSPLFLENCWGWNEIVAEEKTTERKNIIITIIKAFKKQFSERGKWQHKLNCEVELWREKQRNKEGEVQKIGCWWDVGFVKCFDFHVIFPFDVKKSKFFLSRSYRKRAFIPIFVWPAFPDSG